MFSATNYTNFRKFVSQIFSSKINLFKITLGCFKSVLICELSEATHECFDKQTIYE